MPKGVPSSAGSGGGGHTRRSTGTRSSSQPPMGGGVKRPGSTRATTPKGSGSGTKVPFAQVKSPVASKKVIGQSGRTVAGTGRKIKSS